MLSIVDEDLESNVRWSMPIKLLSLEVPETVSVGYPQITCLTEVDLSDLVGPESWFIFRAADVDEVG